MQFHFICSFLADVTSLFSFSWRYQWKCFICLLVGCYYCCSCWQRMWVCVCVCGSIFSAAAVFCLLFWWMCQAHTHTLTSRLFWPILNHGAGCNTISTCHSLAVLSFSQRVVYVDIYFLYSLHVHFSTDGAFLDLLFPFRINYSSIGKIDTRKKQRKKSELFLPSIWKPLHRNWSLIDSWQNAK